MPSRRAFLASVATAALAGCTLDDQFDACRGDETVLALDGIGYQVEPAGALQGGSGLLTEADSDRVPALERAFGIGVDVGVDHDSGRREKDDYTVLGDVTEAEVRRVFDEVGIAINELAEYPVPDLGSTMRARIEEIRGYHRGFLPYDRIEVEAGIGPDFLTVAPDVPGETVDRLRAFLDVQGRLDVSIGDPSRGNHAEMTAYGPPPNLFMVSHGSDPGPRDHGVSFTLGDVGSIVPTLIAREPGMVEEPGTYAIHLYLDRERVKTVRLAPDEVSTRYDETRDEEAVLVDRRVELGGLTRVEQRAVFAALTHPLPSVPTFARPCD